MQDKLWQHSMKAVFKDYELKLFVSFPQLTLVIIELAIE